MTQQTYHFHGESHRLDAAARDKASGQFVTLTNGVTHYELAGPVDGPPVVLVHGFSVPSFIWDPTFSELAGKGFRVLRYDLFGRGYSDRPDVTYDQALFNRQLGDLLTALMPGTAVNLVGLSMGGGIAVSFTAQHPEQVNKLALIDPSGMPMRLPLPGRLLHVPGIGEWLIDYFGEKLIILGMACDAYARKKAPDLAGRYREQMQYQGFRRALLSTWRNAELFKMTAEYEAVGRQDRPVLLIWGVADKTVPLSVSEKVRQAIPQAELHPIDAGHIPHHEKPDEVNSLLVRFFS